MLEFQLSTLRETEPYLIIGLYKCPSPLTKLPSTHLSPPRGSDLNNLFEQLIQTINR